MPGMSVSGIENKLIENIFKQSRLSSAGLQGDAAIGALSTAETLTRYAFKDFVNYFIRLEQLAEARRRQLQAIAPVAGASGSTASSLKSAGMHLDIRIESFQDVAAEDVDDGQPVTVHEHAGAEGLAREIEIRLPQTQADGSVKYTVSVIHLAVTSAQTQQAPTAGSSGQTGELSLATAASAGSVEAFYARSAAVGKGSPGTEIWQYSADNAEQLLDNERKLEALRREQIMSDLADAAAAVVRYLQVLQVNAEYHLTKEEAELVDQALEKGSDTVVRQRLVQMFKNKKRVLEKIERELKKKQEELEKAEQLGETPAQTAAKAGPGEENSDVAKAKSLLAAQRKFIRKLLDEIEHITVMTEEKQEIDPGMLQELLKDFNDANLAWTQV